MLDGRAVSRVGRRNELPVVVTCGSTAQMAFEMGSNESNVITYVAPAAAQAHLFRGTYVTFVRPLLRAASCAGQSRGFCSYFANPSLPLAMRSNYEQALAASLGCRPTLYGPDDPGPRFLLLPPAHLHRRRSCALVPGNGRDCPGVLPTGGIGVADCSTRSSRPLTTSSTSAAASSGISPGALDTLANQRRARAWRLALP